MQYFFGLAICFSSLFLVLLVLVQRGRGGGLTGALGGPGGQSAFGTKAGDLFTKITIGVATAWIFLCASSVYFLKTKAPPELGGGSATSNATSTIGGTDEEDTSGTSGVTGTSSPIDPSSTAPAPAGAGEAEVTGEVTSEDFPVETEEAAGDEGAGETESEETENTDDTTGAPTDGQ